MAATALPSEAAADLALAPPARRGDVVRALAARFTAARIDAPGADARHLVAAALGIDSAGLIATADAAVTPREADAIGRLAARRLDREPVSRILGRRWFYGLELDIGPATLDPRPETETLVDGVLATLSAEAAAAADAGRPTERGPRILDLGTGSGAILIALLSAMPRATGVGVDISEAALAVAWRNAERHGVADRARLQRGSWLDGLDGEVFDLIVSNPPYIARDVIGTLDPEVRCFDPRVALDGGADGLDAYRAIISRVGAHLAAEGLLVLEVGDGQAADVVRLFAGSGRLEPEPPSPLWHDLSGRVRCVASRPHILRSEKKSLAPARNRASLESKQEC